MKVTGKIKLKSNSTIIIIVLLLLHNLIFTPACKSINVSVYINWIVYKCALLTIPETCGLLENLYDASRRFHLHGPWKSFEQETTQNSDWQKWNYYTNSIKKTIPLRIGYHAQMCFDICTCIKALKNKVHLLWPELWVVYLSLYQINKGIAHPSSLKCLLFACYWSSHGSPDLNGMLWGHTKTAVHP